MKQEKWIKSEFERLEKDPEFVAAELMININNQICIRMKEKDISQYELAHRLGKSQPFISRLLNHGTNMTLKTLAKLSLALDLKIVPPRLLPKEKSYSHDFQIKYNEPIVTCSQSQAELFGHKESRGNKEQKDESFPFAA